MITVSVLRSWSDMWERQALGTYREFDEEYEFGHTHFQYTKGSHVHWFCPLAEVLYCGRTQFHAPWEKFEGKYYCTACGEEI